MNKEQTAIERLKLASEMSFAYYGKPLLITTSGGKDSDVCLTLVQHSGIPYEVLHSHTTADTPQTVRHVREQFRKLELSGVSCSIRYPVYRGVRTSMWRLIPMKLMPPTRIHRYCCAIMKETGGRSRMITTGVRWSESASRKANRGIFESMPKDKARKIILNNDNDDIRQLFEHCSLKAKRTCNPIIDWEDSDVWDFIRSYHIQTNPLYECGFHRVGCIGCPMAGKQRYFEFHMFPQYEIMYRHAFARLVEERKRQGKCDAGSSWETAEGVWHWWMQEDENQLTFQDYLDEVSRVKTFDAEEQ